LIFIELEKHSFQKNAKRNKTKCVHQVNDIRIILIHQSMQLRNVLYHSIAKLATKAKSHLTFVSVLTSLKPSQPSKPMYASYGDLL